MPIDQQLQDAVAHHRAGRLVAAEALYRAVIERGGGSVGAIKLLGVLLAQSARAALAEPLLAQAAAALPDDADTHGNWGAVLVDLGRAAEAVAVLRRVVRLAPQAVSGWTNLARAELAAQDLVAADTALKQALTLNPRHPPALAVRAEVLLRQGQPGAAVAAARAALAAGHDRPATHANLVAALARSGDYAESLAAAEQARLRWPDDAGRLVGMAVALEGLGRTREAAAALQRAVTLAPDLAEAWATLASVLTQQGDLAGAETAADRALLLRPDYPIAALNWALALLGQGRWADGFAAFEARLLTDVVTFPALTLPRWTGACRPGLHLLLVAEQGLGDTLQFCRYALQLAAQGVRVSLAPQPRLVPLLAGLPNIAVVSDATAVVADAWAPLMSLPHLLQAYPSAPHPPYVPAPNAAAHWAQRLRAPGTFTVGLNWQGNPLVRVDRGRSMPLRELLPLAMVPDCRFVALQHGAGSEQLAHWSAETPLVQLPADIDVAGAFVDTAAILVGGLDLLITTDTALAHLAGALGVPCWVLLQAVPDWRWGLSGTLSPWYESLRLYRQPQPGAWGPVLGRVAADLSRLVQQHPRG
jgi:tetratricopeptide (TPR) repeat protein